MDGAILDLVAKAYETARSGGKHAGFLRIYETLPNHLIGRAIRSLTQRVAEHRGWIEAPYLKIGPNAPDDAIRHLVRSRWPKEIAAFEEQIEILQSILEERRK